MIINNETDNINELLKLYSLITSITIKYNSKDNIYNCKFIDNSILINI